MPQHRPKNERPTLPAERSRRRIGQPLLGAGGSHSFRRPCPWPALAGLAFLLFGLSCARDPVPYSPRRPALAPESVRNRDRTAERAGIFPERTILSPRDESPPETLARVERIYRSIAAVEGSDDEWVRTILKAEIDTVLAEVGRLELGGGSVMKLRLGQPSPEEQAEFRKAAELYVRWAIARMRSGDIDDRVKGTEQLDDAMDFDPGNPILAVIRASYLDMAGFRSNAVRSLESFDRDHGSSDLVDLLRLRKQERIWKILGFDESLEDATRLADQVAIRSGGWSAAPPWLILERARLRYLADSLDAAAADARAVITALDNGAEPDTLTEFQARLLLGAIDVRELEFARADTSFRNALELGRRHPSALELASLFEVPWDLWSDDERSSFDRSSDRNQDVHHFWRSHDPILATPALPEEKIEYYRRVADAWFMFSGVDPGLPGPFTDAGRALLRFGAPSEWRRLGARPREGVALASLDYGVNMTWEFAYRLRQENVVSDRKITFQDPSSLARFSATDSLRGAAWPPFWFNFDFDGRAYRLNYAAAQFRDWDGRTRLVLSFDTLVPNYSIRYPLQGFRFGGIATVETAVLRRADDGWRPHWAALVDLDSETMLTREREFRRRSGTAALTGIDRGVYRVSSLLRLRDESGRTVAIAVDNGEPTAYPGFGWNDFEASDLLLTASVEGIIQEEVERKIRDELVVFGPDPSRFEVVPRASTRFFPGEDLAFYLEVYNLDHREGVSVIDLNTTLQSLRPDGTLDYAVTLTGSSSNLTKFGIDQWNVARSLGLGELDPGDYNLVIELWDRKASRRLQRNARFRVVTPDEVIDLYNWKQLDPPRIARLDGEPAPSDG